MPTHFVFVDETGDLGQKGTDYYGYGIVEVPVSQYARIRQILAEERWRFRLYRDFELDPSSRPAVNVLTQLRELAEWDIISVSGFYINKGRYRGRYLTWSEIKRLNRRQWPHRLRNYLLRKALETHYSTVDIEGRSIDLVLDRIAVNSLQRQNLEDYIKSRKDIPLREPFKLPRIDYVTISDSSYTGALQVAHLVADIVKKSATHSLSPQEMDLARFVRLSEFLGTDSKGSSFESDLNRWEGLAPPNGVTQP